MATIMKDRFDLQPFEILRYDTEPTKRCAANHIAPWLVEPRWFNEAIAAYNADRFQVEAAHDDESARVLYILDSSGIARIPLQGHLMKFDSKFGGTSTLRARRAVRTAASDPDVQAILLHIDSPGGTVAGTEELARDVANAGKLKPVFAHMDDLGASAAFWIASQTSHISANKTALVGSIGTVAVIEDSSEAAKNEGIKVHVISTGKFKGSGVPGTEVTKEHLVEIQEIVDDLNEHFLEAVSLGRGMSMEAVEDIADGRVHIASKAAALGLVDTVQSFDDTITMIRSGIDQRASERKEKREQGRMRADKVFGKV